MIKKFILLLSAVFIINIVPAYADTSEVNVTVNEKINQVAICGSAQTGVKEVTCYVESPDNRVVYIGSVKTQNGEYNINFTLANPEWGAYHGKIKSGNSTEVKEFWFYYYLRAAEFEQVNLGLTDVVKPSINDVDIEVIDFIKGIYQITLSEKYCTYDERAEDPFFFYNSSDGEIKNVEHIGRDSLSFTFYSNPGTGDRTVRLYVGFGDGLGNVDRKVVLLKGNDN